MSSQSVLGLSSFISNEFFSFGKKEQETIKKEEPSLWDWIGKNTDKNGLKDHVVLKDETVMLRGHTASMFLRNGKEIDHVLNEFKQDFKIYQSLFSSNKAALIEFGKAQKALWKDLDDLASTETTYEEVRAAVLKHQVDAVKFSPPNNIARKFSYPKTYMLGDFNGYFSKDSGRFDTKQTPREADPVEIKSLAEKDKNEIVKLAFDILMFHTDLEYFDDEKIGLCWDMTDSPTRGFMVQINRDQDVMDVLSVFTEHGMTETELNAGLIYILGERTKYLSEALWGYIRASVK